MEEKESIITTRSETGRRGLSSSLSLSLSLSSNPHIHHLTILSIIYFLLYTIKVQFKLRQHVLLPLFELPSPGFNVPKTCTCISCNILISPLSFLPLSFTFLFSLQILDLFHLGPSSLVPMI